MGAAPKSGQGSPGSGSRAGDLVTVRIKSATARELLGAMTARQLPTAAVMLEVGAALARALGQGGSGKKSNGKGGGNGGAKSGSKSALSLIA